MGATLLSGQGLPGPGATFRAWAPRASAVYLNGVFNGTPRTGQTPGLLLAKDANGYWSGFLPDAADGDTYLFYVVGPGSSGIKRDPYARELANDPATPFPLCPAIIRSANAYPWHDAAFRTPDFAGMVVYQLHIGTYAPASPGQTSTYLDVLSKLPYLTALGVNVVQPLPVYEEEDSPSQGYPGLGYQGADLFSPALDYAVYDASALAGYLTTINRLLAARNLPPMTLADITPAVAQLKVMVDLLHVYGIAVLFDVVYNHAGGWAQTYAVPTSVSPSGLLHGDDKSLYFWDCALTTNASGAYDNNQSLYFSDKGFVGGLAFALWNQDVRGFLLNNALFHLNELHADGFRYDEISELLAMNATNGWNFCNELTAAVRAINPRALQNAEYWPDEYGVPAPRIVVCEGEGGLRFDAVQHDGLREAIRSAIGQAAQGATASVEMSGIARSLWPTNFAHSWQTIPCVENHDIVKLGEQPRVPALADGSNPRSWYARSRTRVAMALLLAAPGIPPALHGPGVPRRQAVVPRPAFSGPPHLVGRPRPSRQRPRHRSRHGRPSPLHPGRHRTAQLPARPPRRGPQRLLHLRRRPRHSLPALGPRHWPRRSRRRHLERNHMGLLSARLPLHRPLDRNLQQRRLRQLQRQRSPRQPTGRRQPGRHHHQRPSAAQPARLRHHTHPSQRRTRLRKAVASCCSCRCLFLFVILAKPESLYWLLPLFVLAVILNAVEGPRRSSPHPPAPFSTILTPIAHSSQPKHKSPSQTSGFHPGRALCGKGGSLAL